MCDSDSFDDMVAYRLRRDVLSRRSFGALSVGAGLASLLPIGCQSAGPVAVPVGGTGAPTGPGAGAASGAAMSTTESDVGIVAPDGTCDAYFVFRRQVT